VQQWDLIGIYVAITSVVTAYVGYRFGARNTKSKLQHTLANGKKNQ
jgi:hypothetical protein